MSARGRGRCSEISPENIPEDIVAAAKYLRAQSFVKATAINLMGWSSGGGFALDALSKGVPSSSAPVHAVVAYCPDYDYASPWKTDVPVLILLAGKDKIAPPAKFESLLSRVPARKRVKLIVFPEAYHSFDNPSLPAETSGLYGTMGYNEKAAKAAWEEVEKFLRR